MVEKQNTNKTENEIIKLFQNNDNTPLRISKLYKIFNIKAKEQKKKLYQTLNSLLNSNLLIQENKEYSLNIKPAVKTKSQSSNVIIGRVDMKQTGKAYIISEQTIDDVLIKPNNTKNALHGDTVKVYIFPQRKGRKIEGEIIEIVKRHKETFVGVIEMNKIYAVFVPDSYQLPFNLIIPVDKTKGAKTGDKVIVKITEWKPNSQTPIGEVVNILGKPGSNEVEMNSILAEYGFPLCFPSKVEKAAAAIDTVISDEEIAKRKDMRDVLTFTIDPEDAKDFDDAISFKKLDKSYQIGVHIADVSHYIKPDSIIDKEAFLRGTSVYLVDRVVPMLPEKLSNNLCSLREKEDKLCFSAVFEMNDNAEIISEWFGKTIINSNKRFTYEEAQTIIETQKGLYAKEFKVLNAIAYKLREERNKKGSINFNTPEVKFELDKNAKPIRAYLKETKDSNLLIEDFMLLANRKVAELLTKNIKIIKNSVYRVHDNPKEDKLQELNTFVNKLGFRVSITNQKSTALAINKLLAKLEDRPEANMIKTLILRTMQKAYYSTSNIGHFGLGFNNYTHFTSPIRRYPDVMIHRLLDYFLYHNKQSHANIGQYEEFCKHLSSREKMATEAERESIKLKQIEFLMDKRNIVFDAIISGVSKWGIFTEIIENGCEGLVSMKDMQNDFYYLDEDNYRIVGRSYNAIYKLGDKVRVKVKDFNLAKKQINFFIEE